MDMDKIHDIARLRDAWEATDVTLASIANATTVYVRIGDVSLPVAGGSARGLVMDELDRIAGSLAKAGFNAPARAAARLNQHQQEF